jgi:hypothetical protein
MSTPVKGEETAKLMCYASSVDDAPLTPDELRQLRSNLARLSQSGVENTYRQAYRDCEMKGDRLPRPVAIQQLVQAWRQLWEWRKKERRK